MPRIRTALARSFAPAALALALVAGGSASAAEVESGPVRPNVERVRKVAVEAPAARTRPACTKRRAVRGCRAGHRARVSIIGGYLPHASQWPWIVRIAPVGCGGTLIHPRVVVTAAHCVTDGTGRLDVAVEALTAILGRRTLSATSTGVELKVDRVLVHAAYRGDTLVNDVALLRLASPAQQPVATLGDSNDWRSPAVVMGWGRTAAGPSGPQSDSLLAVDLQLRVDAECAGPSPVPYVPAVMMCAGGSGTGTCKGDSGGPVMMGDGAGGGWELVGLVSFGHPQCDTNGTPSYFTWVAGATLRQWVVSGVAQILQPQTPPPGPVPPATVHTPAPPAPPVPARSDDLDRPALTTLLMWPTRFRAARRGPSAAAIAVGTTISYRVSEASRVTFRVVRCERKRGCRGAGTVGRVVHTGRAGANRLGFSGRVGGRRLRPGRYRLLASARDSAGHRSATERVEFRVVR
jgi:Trypsin